MTNSRDPGAGESLFRDPVLQAAPLMSVSQVAQSIVTMAFTRTLMMLAITLQRTRVCLSLSLPLSLSLCLSLSLSLPLRCEGGLHHAPGWRQSTARCPCGGVDVGLGACPRELPRSSCKWKLILHRPSLGQNPWNLSSDRCDCCGRLIKYPHFCLIEL